MAVASCLRGEVVGRKINRLIRHNEARAGASARERALGVWDILFTHCCNSKAVVT